MSLIFDKKYKLETSENFEEYCKALGKLLIYNDNNNILLFIILSISIRTYFYFIKLILCRIFKLIEN